MWRNWNLLFIPSGNIKWSGNCINSLAVPEKVKHKINTDPVLPYLRIYLKEMKTYLYK
jgi:hypothetical protein